jgi:hypothetical protein
MHTIIVLFLIVAATSCGVTPAPKSASEKSIVPISLDSIRALFKANHYQRVITLAPKLPEMVQKSIDCKVMVADCYIKLNDFAHALINYNACIKSNAQMMGLDGYGFYTNRGLCYIKMNKLDSAHTDFIMALKYASSADIGNTHYNLACVFARMNKSDSALAHVDSSVRNDPALVTGMFHDPDLASIRGNPILAKTFTKYGYIPADTIALPVIKRYSFTLPMRAFRIVADSNYFYLPNSDSIGPMVIKAVDGSIGHLGNVEAEIEPLCFVENGKLLLINRSLLHGSVESNGENCIMKYDSHNASLAKVKGSKKITLYPYGSNGFFFFMHNGNFFYDYRIDKDEKSDNADGENAQFQYYGALGIGGKPAQIASDRDWYMYNENTGSVSLKIRNDFPLAVSPSLRTVIAFSGKILDAQTLAVRYNNKQPTYRMWSFAYDYTSSREIPVANIDFINDEYLIGSSDLGNNCQFCIYSLSGKPLKRFVITCGDSGSIINWRFYLSKSKQRALATYIVKSQSFRTPDDNEVLVLLDTSPILSAIKKALVVH